MTIHGVTREQARDMADAHSEGLHDFLREGCPDCEARPLSDYPPASSPGDKLPPHKHVHRFGLTEDVVPDL